MDQRHLPDTVDHRNHNASIEHLQNLRNRYVSKAVSHGSPVIVDHARGCEVIDINGRRYLDFAGGIGTLNVGHTHPAVVDAAIKQTRKLTHSMFGVAMYESYIRLAESLSPLTPGNFDKKSLFVNSGAEAVENAIKIARAATGRPGVISFSNAFHGRTTMTMGLTHKDHPYKQGFGPFPENLFRVPQPYLYRPAFPDGEVAGCLHALEETLDTHGDEIAAIIFEPVQGEGGFIVAPDDWLIGVAGLARRHGAVLIADEVQTGFGRTGKWFACEHAGIEPDLMVMAKSLAGGFPLGAVTGRAELMDAPQVGGLGGTFGGNPVSCAAALAVIDVIKAEGLTDRAVQLGNRVAARFEQWQEQYSIVGDVRGRGAMMAIELVRDRTTKDPADRETAAVVAEACNRGLIILRAGMFDNVIRVLVPLTVDFSEIDEGLAMLESSLQTVD